MADSKRKAIRLALAARLAEIRTTNGYHTDAGLQPIQHSKFAVTEHDPLPRLALVPADVVDPDKDLASDEIRHWPFVVTGLADADPADPESALIAEDLIADIKRALFRPADLEPGAKPIDGLVMEIQSPAGEQVLDREEGGRTVGCIVPLVVLYTEAFGGS